MAEIVGVKIKSGFEVEVKPSLLLIATGSKGREFFKRLDEVHGVDAIVGEFRKLMENGEVWFEMRSAERNEEVKIDPDLASDILRLIFESITNLCERIASMVRDRVHNDSNFAPQRPADGLEGRGDVGE